MAIQNDGGGRVISNIPNNKGATGAIRRGVTQTRPKIPAPQQIARPAPAPAPPAPRGGGGGNFSQPFSMGGDFSAPAPAPVIPTDAEFLSGDSQYKDQLAALVRALEGANSDFDTSLKNYGTDYTTALGSLGYGDTDLMTEGDQLGWMTKDPNTSAGRGTQAINSDFSGRGMLQSSHFLRAIDNLNRSLNEQKASMDTGKQRFEGDIASKKAAFSEDNKAAQNSARGDALFRKALKFTSV